MVRRMAGPRAGMGVVENKTDRLLGCPARNLAAIPTELPQLPHSGGKHLRIDLIAVCPDRNILILSPLIANNTRILHLNSSRPLPSPIHDKERLQLLLRVLIPSVSHLPLIWQLYSSDRIE
jgi:hypothetical protein